MLANLAPIHERSSTLSVSQIYQAELTQRGYQADAAQLSAVQALERCANEWAQYKVKRSNALKKFLNHPPIPRGVYLYGGVGRGKSFLMDCFFNAVPLRRKTRLHFHEFMREVHHELSQLQGIEDPLNVLAERMAQRYKLICFDEFHISDIADAMILYRLLQALFDNHVGLVATSNYKPDDLYPNGLHRDRLLPAIDLLNAAQEVICVDNGVDYRSLTMAAVALYHCPADAAAHAAMAQTFASLAAQQDEDPVMYIESRQLQALRMAGTVVWFDFETLCVGPRSQNDYLEIAARFHTVFLSDVPHMPVRMSSAARRFTWLVDVLYDRRVKLIISAAVKPEALYTEGPLAHEFARTVSRLREMQSSDYVAQERRNVDTTLV